MLTIPQPSDGKIGGMIKFRTDNGANNLYISTNDFDGAAADYKAQNQKINCLLFSLANRYNLFSFNDIFQTVKY